ncbi:hypothetical protein P5G50_00105 [Leifsonia sp. F6_8S_P_1B]|uniref:Integral membrane protein n=1 Tax=Leifsonia williamsii TaxID=3035919 RepID=A0ABT8K5U8_9MICO|nr:hypothetical protein [Leifsonia williamsii]MDN4612835.1 hypothetical protein [Leifsonia williamsii]
MTFFTQEPEPRGGPQEASAAEGRRSAVHGFGAVGLVALPIILMVAYVLAAFQGWQATDAEQAAVDQKAFPLLITAGVVMGVSAVTVVVLRAGVRGRFAGGTAWVVLAVLSAPIAAYLVFAGFASLDRG